MQRMTDEQRRIVDVLNRPDVKDIEITTKDLSDKITLGQAAKMIEQLVWKLDKANRLIELINGVCDCNCVGCHEEGIPPCPAYQEPDIDDDGTQIKSCCLVDKWLEEYNGDGGGTSD